MSDIRSSILATSRPTHLGVFVQLIRTIIGHRQLMWQMAKREIRDRYAGQALGVLWAVGHPILLMGLYVFLFTYVFPSRAQQLNEDMASSTVTYILAALIPWLTFAESMAKGTGTIVNEAGLVKQVVFPIEILPVKSVLATCLSQLVATGILLLYMVILERSLPWLVFLFPVLFALQMLMMVGVSYALSSVGVYFRDMREIVQVFLSAGIFLAPILYPPTLISKLPPTFAMLLSLNPFSHLVWCYQDVFYYGRFEHPLSWFVLILLSPIVFYLGYRIFRKLKLMFGEAL
jgi:lipopolysaccharide transport system permease protein